MTDYHEESVFMIRAATYLFCVCLPVFVVFMFMMPQSFLPLVILFLMAIAPFGRRFGNWLKGLIKTWWRLLHGRREE